MYNVYPDRYIICTLPVLHLSFICTSSVFNLSGDVLFYLSYHNSPYFTFDTIKKVLSTQDSFTDCRDSRVERDGMKTSDVGRRVRIFDRPAGEGKGLLCTVLEVIDDFTFRVMSDSGRETEYHNFTGVIQFIDEPVEAF